jgi:hypothetical protein
MQRQSGCVHKPEQLSKLSTYGLGVHSWAMHAPCVSLLL